MTMIEIKHHNEKFNENRFIFHHPAPIRDSGPHGLTTGQLPEKRTRRPSGAKVGTLLVSKFSRASSSYVVCAMLSNLCVFIFLRHSLLMFLHRKVYKRERSKAAVNERQ